VNVAPAHAVDPVIKSIKLVVNFESFILLSFTVKN